MLYSERGLDLVIAAILFAAIGKLPVGRLGKQSFVPVNTFRKGLHFRRRHAGGVHHANNASHAGTRNAVDRNVVLFQPLDHADLSQAERPAAAERKTDTGTVWRQG